MNDLGHLEEEMRTRIAEKNAEETFLNILRNELLTQDNRITAYPLFCVQQKRVIPGFSPDCTDLYIYEWIDDPEYCWSTKEKAMEQLLKDGYEEEDFEDKIEEIGCYEYWDFVTAHLTEKAAQLYIDQNKHNLTEPRIYVTSQYRCHEFNKVVEYLAGKEIR